MRHPHKDPLVLEDFFVFPDLLLSIAGVRSPGSSDGVIISSRDLIQVDNLSPVISITGPGDSGKTTLLKSLIKRYAALGLYPLYMDGNRVGKTGGYGPWEVIRSTYEEQFTEESLHLILTSEKDKKVCLLDNIDGVGLDRDRIRALLDEFGFLILTSSTPFLGDVIYSELGGDKAPLNFELMEFSLDLRRELSQKWYSLGLGPESEKDTGGTDTRVESALIIMDEVIGRDLVPSYPLILLTILNIGEPGKEEAPSESSYAHYLEHLITKPIIESTGSEELEAFMLYLSKLAYLIFIERKSSVTTLELSGLFEGQSDDLRLPGRPEDIRNTLLEAGTLGVTELGFSFKYNYIYHYFAAMHLARNLGLESVREDVRRLCRDLGNWEYANIMLFLTHLSDDPLIPEEITSALDSSVMDTPPDSLDERIRELDELIESITSTGEKDKKLRELRAEYASTRERIWVPSSKRRTAYEYKPPSDPELMRRRLENTHKELSLLNIAGELLKKRLCGRPPDPATRGFAQSLYRFWLRSLGASSLNLLKPLDEPSGDTATTYERDHGASRNTCARSSDIRWL